MYSLKAMEHFMDPQNAGVITGDGDGDGGGDGGGHRVASQVLRGEATNTDCGDTALLTLRISDGIIVDARFLSKGCAGAIACCSATTVWLRGRGVAEAKTLVAATIAALLDGLPEAKMGCATMAATAALAALATAGDGSA